MRLKSLRSRTIALAVAATGIAGSFVMLGSTGVALANVCGTQYTGYSGYSSTSSGAAKWDPLETVWTKQPPGCNDFNVVKTNTSDAYGGYLKHSNGTYYLCTEGWIPIVAGSGDWVLCSSVITGTKMAASGTLYYHEAMTVDV